MVDRFRAADTQVLGISVDSVYSHANWARDLGGVSFPLLSDFEPKGAVAASFGHYLAEPGITDRATVIIDKEGVVRYSVSVTPSGSKTRISKTNSWFGLTLGRETMVPVASSEPMNSSGPGETR